MRGQLNPETRLFPPPFWERGYPALKQKLNLLTSWRIDAIKHLTLPLFNIALHSNTRMMTKKYP
jgi:hypothetical protein